MDARKELPRSDGFYLKGEHPITFTAKHLNAMRTMEMVISTYLSPSMPETLSIFGVLEDHPDMLKPGTVLLEMEQSRVPPQGYVRLRDGQLRCTDLLQNITYGSDIGYTLENLFQYTTAIRSVFNLSGFTHDDNPLTCSNLRGPIMSLVTFR